MKSILILMVFGVLAACNGGSSTERLTNRLLNNSMDGIAGAVDKPINLTFEDELGILDVEIKNLSGDVIVRGKPKEATGETTVRIEPRIEIRSGLDSKMKLEELKWKAHIDKNNYGGRTLFIEIEHIDPNAWFIGCDIEVDTARLGAVKIDTKRGKIIVDNNRGAVTLNTIRGEIRVRTPWPITKPCCLVTAQADIIWTTRGEGSGEFDCETIEGTIHSYCRYGRWISVDKRNDMNSLHATLNGGTNPIVMRTVDGDIRITIVEDPHATGTFHWP